MLSTRKFRNDDRVFSMHWFFLMTPLMLWESIHRAICNRENMKEENRNG